MQDFIDLSSLTKNIKKRFDSFLVIVDELIM